MARSRGRRLDSNTRAQGTVGLRPRASVKAVDRRNALQAAQDEILPLDKNVFRTGEKLRHSLGILDSAWRELRDHDYATGTDAVTARETAASWPPLAFATRPRSLATRVAACTNDKISPSKRPTSVDVC